MKYEDWFFEVENYGMRCERFYDDVGVIDKEQLAKTMQKWLRAAYAVGREHMRTEAIQTAQQYRTRMDAGKEHIIVALENLK